MLVEFSISSRNWRIATRKLMLRFVEFLRYWFKKSQERSINRNEFDLIWDIWRKFKKQMQRLTFNERERRSMNLEDNLLKKAFCMTKNNWINDIRYWTRSFHKKIFVDYILVVLKSLMTRSLMFWSLMFWLLMTHFDWLVKSLMIFSDWLFLSHWWLDHWWLDHWWLLFIE